MELHEVFERVSAKVPEVRPTLLASNSHRLHWVDGIFAWRRSDNQRDGTVCETHDAEQRIIAACVRLLPGHFWCEHSGVYSVFVGSIIPENVSSGPTLAIALLLAVEVSATP